MIHDIIFLISFIGIIISIIQIVRFPEKIGYMIAPITYVANVFLYNFALHFNLLDIQSLEIWSSVVRLHSLFMLISYIIIIPVKRTEKIKNGGKK